MKGTLSEGVLPELLRELYVGRKTGLLKFTRGEERRSVRVRQGHIVHATSNVKEERLGETLVRHGLLNQVDLDRATEIVIRDKKRLGIALQELGVFDRPQLEESMAVHVRELILKGFEWSDGGYSVAGPTGGAPDQDEDVSLKVSTGEMILEAVRRVQDPDVVRYALGNQDRVLALSTDPLLRFQKITLSPVDGYVLSRVDGTLSAREVIQLINMSAEETQRSMVGLLCTGVDAYPH